MQVTTGAAWRVTGCLKSAQLITPKISLPKIMYQTGWVFFLYRYLSSELWFPAKAGGLSVVLFGYMRDSLAAKSVAAV